MNKQPKILVVDDDPAILSSTRRVLEQAGYETLGAQDGQEALKLTRARRPDLLLLDVNMPKMDGFEVCRRIKADPALAGTFIIIMSSTRNDSDSQVDGLNMGADGYIARPVANRELLARVQAMLRIQAGERALQVSNAQWSVTFDAVGEAILLTDANFTILKCNQAAAEMWQTPLEALVGKKCYQVVHGTETPASACPLALVCETKSRQVLTFAQNERWLEAKVDPMFDANGNFSGTVHVIADITARKQAEEVLRALSARQEAILSAVPDILMEVDQNKVYTWANSAGLAFFGEDVIGKEAAFYFEGEQDTYGIVKPLFNGSEDTIYVESWQRRKDGAKRLLTWWCRVLKDTRGNAVGALSSAHDITENKWAEEALRESEKRYRRITEGLTDYQYSVRIENGRPVETIQSPTCANVTGYTPEEFAADPYLWISMIAPEDCELVNERVQQILAGLEIPPIEHRIRRKDGEMRWVSDTTILFKDAAGNLLSYDGVIKDITERKQAEEALRESEDKFKYIFEHSVSGKSITLVSGELNVNRSFCEMLGYSRAELQNRKWQEITHPEDMELTQNEINKLLSGEKELIRFTKRYIHKNGSTVWAEVGAALRRGKDGKPLYFMTSINDITARKQAENALRENEQRLATIYDTVGDVIFYLTVEPNEQYRFNSVNPAFGKVTGLPSGQVLGKKVNEVIPEPSLNLVLGKYRQAIKEKAIVRWEETSDYPTGRLTGEVSVAPIFDEAGNCTHLVGSVHDITERKRADDALRNSEARLHTLVQTIPDLIWLKDAEGVYLSCNKMFERFFGDREADIVGKTDYDFVDRELADFFRKHDRKAMAAGKPTNNEEMITFADDGHRAFLETIKTPMYDDRGTLIGVLGIGRDITARKQAEDALNESKLLLHLLIESLPQNIYAKDVYGRFTFANQRYCATQGKSQEEIVGKTDFELHPPELAEKYRADDRQVMETGKAIELEEEHQPLNEKKFFVQVIKTPFYDSKGQTAGTLGIFWDITERKRSEKVTTALYDISKAVNTSDTVQSLFVRIYEAINGIIEAKNCFIALIDDAGEKIVFPYEIDENPDDFPVMIALTDPRSLTAEVIRSRKLLLLDEQELNERYASGKNRLWKVKPKCWMGVPLLLGERVIGAMAVQSYDKATKYTNEDAILFSIAAEQVAIAIQSKRAEEEIRQLNTELERRVVERTAQLRDAQEKLVRQEKLAVLGQLAGSVGHELRNPLGIINNAIYYLRLVQPDAQAKVREYLGIIEQEAHTADKIISDLLDFSRIKSVDVEPVVVSELVRRTLERFPAPENIRVTLDLPEDLPTVYVDPRQMTQVLGNLVVNACQAMAKGGELSVISKQLSVSSEQSVKTGLLSTEPLNTEPLNTGHPAPALTSTGAGRAGWLLITVKDTGSGITPENMEKLFEPLFTTKPKGIGLGLAVSRKLVEANGGRIEVESEVGKGSTFTLYLPVKP